MKCLTKHLTQKCCGGNHHFISSTINRETLEQNFIHYCNVFPNELFELVDGDVPPQLCHTELADTSMTVPIRFALTCKRRQVGVPGMSNVSCDADLWPEVIDDGVNLECFVLDAPSNRGLTTGRDRKTLLWKIN